MSDLHWGRFPTHPLREFRLQEEGEKEREREREGEGREEKAGVMECIVEAIQSFQAQVEGEISLEKGDVVVVSRIMEGTTYI